MEVREVTCKALKDAETLLDGHHKTFLRKREKAKNTACLLSILWGKAMCITANDTQLRDNKSYFQKCPKSTDRDSFSSVTACSVKWKVNKGEITKKRVQWQSTIGILSLILCDKSAMQIRKGPLNDIRSILSDLNGSRREWQQIDEKSRFCRW